MLPETRRRPPEFVQQSVAVTISRLVRPDLALPPIAVSRGDVPWSGQPCQKHPSMNTATRACGAQCAQPRRRTHQIEKNDVDLRQRFSLVIVVLRLVQLQVNCVAGFESMADSLLGGSRERFVPTPR